jgi:hypothetical protein
MPPDRPCGSAPGRQILVPILEQYGHSPCVSRLARFRAEYVGFGPLKKQIESESNG